MSVWLCTIFQMILWVIFSPLWMGLIRWTKCSLQNRKSPSLLRPYYELSKLFRKETVIPQTASFIFTMVPVVVFSISVVLSGFVPLFVNSPSGNDVIVFIGLLALARFFLTLAGLDVGTSFGGMGASREMMISTIAEPALLMALFTIAMNTTSTNLSVMMHHMMEFPIFLRPSLLFAGCGFALVALAETGRIPVDNPDTHLELTMVHEAMILEYSGRYLAWIEWASSIKSMLFSVLFLHLFFPWGMTEQMDLNSILISFLTLCFKLFVFAWVLSFVELQFAKLRLFRVPSLLNVAFLFGLLGVLSHIILEVS